MNPQILQVNGLGWVERAQLQPHYKKNAQEGVNEREVY